MCALHSGPESPSTSLILSIQIYWTPTSTIFSHSLAAFLSHLLAHNYRVLPTITLETLLLDHWDQISMVCLYRIIVCSLFLSHTVSETLTCTLIHAHACMHACTHIHTHIHTHTHEHTLQVHPLVLLGLGTVIATGRASLPVEDAWGWIAVDLVEPYKRILRHHSQRYSFRWALKWNLQIMDTVGQAILSL